MSANTGLSEQRVRVICHLPYRSGTGHREAFQNIIKYIKQQRNGALPVTGYTYSSLRPPVFQGYWWGIPDSKRNDPNAKREWVPDDIVMLTIDLAASLQDPRVVNFVERLKARILKLYEDCGCSQDEIWIIAHDSFRS